MAAPRCAVPGCDRAAVVEVIFYDVYPSDDGHVDDVVYEQDETCPYLCMEHLSENEARCQRVTLDLPHEQKLLTAEELRAAPEIREPAGPVRRYRDGGSLHYSYTNRCGGNGFSIYRPLKGWSL
jgi:hypothetical protein